jgi:seryl-tRNA synthetase
MLKKKVNEVQKQITAKKKVRARAFLGCSSELNWYLTQAKENADELVAEKKQIDTQVENLKKEAKEFEIKMRAKASTVGNIVGKNVPTSLTEVWPFSVFCYLRL